MLSQMNKTSNYLNYLTIKLFNYLINRGSWHIKYFNNNLFLKITYYLLYYYIIGLLIKILENKI